MCASGTESWDAGLQAVTHGDKTQCAREARGPEPGGPGDPEQRGSRAGRTGGPLEGVLGATQEPTVMFRSGVRGWACPPAL